MRRLKIAHSADFHFDREHQEPSLASLQAFLAFGRQRRVDLWVLAGDLFNRAVQNTGSSGFPRLVRVLRQMMDVAPIVAVRGTPTHDLPGCYESLQLVRGAHGLTLLDSADSLAWLTGAGELLGAPRGADGDGRPEDARLLVLGCPEPSAEEGIGQRLAEWGEARRRHADLPCLFVFHGLVRGAALQNGQIIGRGEVAVSRRELAAVGADYYALGHIHLAQRVAGLPAWYPGSAFPVNWGERDPKSFRYVLLGAKGGRFAATVCRVPYPHPPRRKLTVPPDGRLEGDLAGCQVWLEVPVTREEAGRVDRRALLDRLLAAGAAAGSRVTLLVLPAEAVRCAQIREVHRLEDKLEVWAAASEERIGPDVLAKARQLEAEARRGGAAPAGLHIRIRSLRLRGAVGIRKGQGRPEIALDLDRYAPDLIALVGPNGAGKTTLIENMHPFPEMLTRPGRLQEHFYLRDSYRDLRFTDERSGDDYRALLRIDGRNPTGRVEHHLYRNGVRLTNGRREDYLERIEALFGSLSLFLRSVFVPQRPNRGHPDLSEATKGEKKALFRELAGLDYLQGYAESARQKARVLEEEAGRLEPQADLVRRIVSALPERERLRTEKASALERLTAELAESERKLARLRGERRALEEAERRSRERKAGLEELGRRVGALLEERRSLQEEVYTFQTSRPDREDAEARLAEIDGLKQQEADLLERKAGALAAGEAAAGAQQRAAALRQEAAVLRERESCLEGRVADLEAALREEARCPRCGHVFSRVDAEGRADARLAEARGVLRRVRRAHAAAERRLEKLEEGGLPPTDPSAETGRELAQVRERLSRCRPVELRTLLSGALAAEGRILEVQRRIAKLDEGIQALQEEARGLAARVGDAREERAGEVEAALRETEARREETVRAVARAEQDLLHLDGEIAGLSAQAARLGELEEEIGRVKRSVAEWLLLERACGLDGVQALELDAMGPGIAEVANRLLQAAYGARFQIEFRTTRLGGTGSRRRQIEDFQIRVFDLESGSEQLLETLSGGEAVWVKRAISDAFAIVRDRSTGQRFLTAFQDEADGALDPESRLAFFQMLRAAHRESGRTHTIVITHSQEAQEMIPQRISLSALTDRAGEKNAIDRPERVDLGGPDAYS